MNLTQNTHPLVSDHPEVATETAHVIGSITDMRSRLNGNDPDSVDIIATVFPRFGSLQKPVSATEIRVGIERIQIVKIRIAVARFRVSLVDRGSANQTVRRTRWQFSRKQTIVGKPGNFRRLTDPVDLLVTEHRFRLLLVVVRTVFDQFEVVRVVYRGSAREKVNASIEHRDERIALKLVCRTG